MRVNAQAIRRQCVIALLGFASGLPLALTASTLQTWFAAAGVDIVQIGLLALVGQPYLFKFLWAPLLDRYVPGLLDRRRGWLVIFQFALIATLYAMSCFDPALNVGLLAVLAFALACFSASQDIVVDAYRVDILPEAERGLGAAFGVMGYRIGMLISGGAALIYADFFGWAMTYRFMAAFMCIGLLATLFAPSPPNVRQPSTLKAAVLEPFKQFLSQPFAWAFLLLIFFYKLAETFTSASGLLTNVFLLNHVGFSLTEIGTVNKLIGISTTIVGVMIGGIVLTRMRLYPALFTFGVGQALSNLGYMLLAIVGKSMPLFIAVVCFDNFFAGLGTAAIIAFMMSLCDTRYSATQFALLTAFAGLGRIVLGPLAGFAVKQIGWAHFYFWTFLLALPALLLLWGLQRAAPLQFANSYDEI